MSLKNVKRKASKKLIKSNQTTIDFLCLIMVHNEGNIGKKIQA